MLCRRRTEVLAATLAAALAGSALAAGESKPEPMERKAAEEFLKGVIAARSKMKTLAVAFTDTKQSIILAGETVAKGYLRIRKPDSVRRDILEPSRSAIILRGKTGWFCQPGRTARSFDLEKSRGESVAGVIFKLLTAESFDLAELEKRFEVKTLTEGDDLTLEMKPREKELAERLPVVRVTFAPKGVWPKRAQWETRDGDVVTDAFGESAVNVEIPEEALSVPVDWKEKLPPEEGPATGAGG